MRVPATTVVAYDRLEACSKHVREAFDREAIMVGPRGGGTGPCSNGRGAAPVPFREVCQIPFLPDTRTLSLNGRPLKSLGQCVAVNGTRPEPEYSMTMLFKPASAAM